MTKKNLLSTLIILLSPLCCFAQYPIQPSHLLDISTIGGDSILVGIDSSQVIYYWDLNTKQIVDTIKLQQDIHYPKISGNIQNSVYYLSNDYKQEIWIKDDTLKQKMPVVPGTLAKYFSYGFQNGLIMLQRSFESPMLYRINYESDTSYLAFPPKKINFQATDMQLSPSHEKLALIYKNGIIEIRSAKNFEIINTYQIAATKINQFKWVDEDSFVVQYMDEQSPYYKGRNIYYYQIAGNRKLRIDLPKGLINSRINSFDIAAKSKELVLSMENQAAVLIYDLNSGNLRNYIGFIYDDSYPKKRFLINSVAFTYSGDKVFFNANYSDRAALIEWSITDDQLNEITSKALSGIKMINLLETDPRKKITYKTGKLVISSVPDDVLFNQSFKKYSFRRSDTVFLANTYNDSVHYLTKIRYPFRSEYGHVYYASFRVDHLILEKNQICLIGRFEDSCMILRYDYDMELEEVIPFEFEGLMGARRIYDSSENQFIVEDIRSSKKDGIYSINTQTGQVSHLDKSSRLENAYCYFWNDFNDVTKPFDFYPIHHLPVSQELVFLLASREAALFDVIEKNFVWRTSYENYFNCRAISYTGDTLIHFLSTDGYSESNKMMFRTLRMSDGEKLSYKEVDAIGSKFCLSGDSLLLSWGEGQRNTINQTAISQLETVLSDEWIEVSKRKSIDSVMAQYDQPFDHSKLLTLQAYFKPFGEELKTMTFEGEEKVSILKHDAGRIFDIKINDSILYIDGTNGTYGYNTQNLETVFEGDDIPTFLYGNNYYFIGRKLYQTLGDLYLRRLDIPDFSVHTILPSSIENLVFLSGSNDFGLFNLYSNTFTFKYQGNAYSSVISEDRSKILFWERINASINLMTFGVIDHFGIDSIEVNKRDEDYFQEVDFLSGSSSKAILLFGDHVDIVDLANSNQQTVFFEEENYFIEDIFQKNGLIFILSSKKDAIYTNKFSDSKRHDSLPKDRLSILDLEARSLITYSFELSTSSEKFYGELLIGDKIKQEVEETVVNKDDINKIDIKLQKDVSVDDIIFSDKGNYFITSENLDPYFVLWQTRSLLQIQEFYCKDCQDFQVSEERDEIGYYQGGFEDKLIVLNSNTLKKKQVIDIEEGSFESYSLKNQIFYTTDPFEDNYGTKAFVLSDSKEVFSDKRELSDIRITNKGIIGIEGNDLVMLKINSNRLNTKVKTSEKADFIWNYEISNDGKYFLIVYSLENNTNTLGNHPWELKSVQNDVILQGKVPFGTPSPVLSKDSKRLYYIDIADSVYYLNNDTTAAYTLYSLYEHDIITGDMSELFTFNSFSGVGALKANPENGNLLFSVGSQIYSYNEAYKRIVKKSSFSIKEEYTRYSSFNEGRNALIRNGSTVHVIDYQNPQSYRKFSTGTTSYLQLIGGSLWVAEDSAKYKESKDNYKITYEVYDAASPEIKQEIVLKNKTLQKAFSFVNATELLLVTFSSQDDYEILIQNEDGSMEKLGSEKFIYGDESTVTSNKKYFIAKLSKDIHVYEIQDKKKLVRKIKDAIKLLPTHQDNLFILEKSVNNYGREYYLYNLAQDKIVRKIGRAPYPGSYTISLSENDRYLYGLSSEYYFRFPLFEEDGLEISRTHDFGYSIDFYEEDGRLVVINYNEMIFLNMEFAEDYRIISDQESGVTLKLPSGEYFILAGKEPRFLNYIKNNKAYPFDQFDLYYNRPDLVLEKIGYADQNLIQAYHKAYLKRVNRRGLDPGTMSLSTMNSPVVEITNTKNISFLSNKSIINLQIEASDSLYQIQKVNIWVNNNPLFGSSGLNVLEKGQNKYHFAHDIELSKGLNTIQVSCTNEVGAQSSRETLEVQYNPAEPKSHNLYLAIVSVSDYQDDKYDLNFAAKDGEDILHTFQEQNLINYDSVYVRALFDRDVKRDNILKLKKWLLTSNVDDKVILFVSGHGFLDDNLEWWFATHDIEFENPGSNGVNYREIESLLDSIPARNKLLLMDACHSGEVDKGVIATSVSEDEGVLKRQVFENSQRRTVVPRVKLTFQNSFNLMQETFINLSRGSGSHVISAAAGDSYAYEYGEYKNGVFTYSIISGIKNGFADMNSDGQITISELSTYVGKEVTRITKGHQLPMNRQVNLENDFVIWFVNKTD